MLYTIYFTECDNYYVIFFDICLDFLTKNCDSSRKMGPTHVPIGQVEHRGVPERYGAAPRTDIQAETDARIEKSRAGFFSTLVYDQIDLCFDLLTQLIRLALAG